jgi:YVTN family beta-propeller protein
MSYRYFFTFLFAVALFSTKILAIPVITDVNPAFGPSTGGTTVVITGSGFTGTTAVNFGTTAAASFVVNTDSSITAMTSPHSPQVVNIFVTAPSGTSVANDTSFFTFQGDWQAYVVNSSGESGNVVSVIDVMTDTVTATVHVGVVPTPIDLLPDGSLVFVANTSNNSISVIDTATNTVINTIPPLSSSPFGTSTIAMLPNGAKNYVSLRVNNALAVIDNSTETQDPNIPVGLDPFNIAITPDGTKLYSINFGDNSVSVIDTASDTVTTTVHVGLSPVAASTTPDGTQLYVVNLNGGIVFVIDTLTNTVTAAPVVGTNPSAIAITPNGSKAFIANLNSNNVSVIDTTTNTVIDTVATDVGPSLISILPNGLKAYVMNSTTGSVTVIDTTSDSVITTIPVGAFPQAQALSPDGKKLFVVNFNDDTVSVIDTTTDTVIDTIAVGGEPAAIGITADQAPLAQFTITVQPIGLPSLFDASASNSPTGTIANYFWDFGDGTTANTPLSTITHVYNAPGTYVVTLIVTNTAGTSLSQTFYFSSASNIGPTAEPVTNNNGGPTAIRVRALTIGIIPPSNFIGCVKTNRFLNKTEYVLNAVFNASPTPGVLFYQVFLDGVLVKEIPATSPLHFQLCLPSKQSANRIVVVAVGPGGSVSSPVPITIVGSCCFGN